MNDSTTGPSSIAARRSLRLAAGVVALLLVVTAGLVIRHRLAPKHLMTVAPNVLYRSATLPPAQLVDVAHEYDIQTVVNLRSVIENKEPWHEAQANALEAAGVQLIDLPMYSGHTPDVDVEARWLALLEDESSWPILVHCEYGVVRTGIMVSLYEIEHRQADPDSVFETMPLFGHEIQPEIRERIQSFLASRQAEGH